MSSWSDYKKHAQERGALALEVYCVVSTPTGDIEAVLENLADHLAYQKSLEDQGVLMFAGPLSDETGHQMQGCGQIIYRAESFEAAQQLAEQDPMHSNGARAFTLRKWLINEGSMQVNVKLAGQSVSL